MPRILKYPRSLMKFPEMNADTRYLRLKYILRRNKSAGHFELCVENSSRSTSVLSDAADGGACTDLRSPASAVSRLATFQTGDSADHHRSEKSAGSFGYGGRGDKVWLDSSGDKTGEEKQSSSSRDSGQGASEDSALSRTSGNDDSASSDRTPTNGSRGHTIYGRGDYSNKRAPISGFERPPLLKTFQSSGASRNSPPRDGTGGDAGTFPSQKGRRELINDNGTYSPKTDSMRVGGYTSAKSPYQSMTSLKQIGGTIANSPTKSPSSINKSPSLRPPGSPVFPDKTRSSELYQKRASKSNQPPGLDDTILKRLVINGRKGGNYDGGRAEDDGYCSNAPSGDSVKDTDMEGSFVNSSEIPDPPPPYSACTGRDARLCSEPPLSPYTKMSSLPPFTYPIQETSTAQTSLPPAYTGRQGGQNTIPKLLGMSHSNINTTAPSATNNINRSVPSINTMNRGNSGSSSNNFAQSKSPLFIGNTVNRNSPLGLSGKNNLSSSPYNPSSPRPPFTGGVYAPSTTAATTTPSLSSLNKEYGRLRNLNPSDSSLETALSCVPGHHELMNDSLETQEDSNTTTTSGSYAVDEEDLAVDLPPANVFV
ncbi:hypothetical protein PoB_002140700 [Plakobranchus ocellatus]|uniref:Uncharacterized protein n=1 Tax=Plakobranchus ocellatus TaxID=259542 RepID=A0AAV3ZK22_9GAST|nr:hypothetical protein PoB_002140700 [Plakobranchus ocellatus]